MPVLNVVASTLANLRPNTICLVLGQIHTKKKVTDDFLVHFSGISWKAR